MSVYVDNMRAPFGRMIMCHMIADTTDELLSMARSIGVNVKWIQYPGTHRERFDIALSKRAIAVRDYGAIEVTWRQVASMDIRRKVTGTMGDPLDAESWLSDYYEAIRLSE